MKTAVIRVDSSVQMGTGHVMRCLTLAEQLASNNYEVTFITRNYEGNLYNLIREKGFKVYLLDNPVEQYNKFLDSCFIEHFKWLGIDQEKDANETICIIKQNYFNKVDLLVIDHYGLDYIWEKKMRSLVKEIFVIDDLADRHHDCDILLDQNFYINMEDRYKNLVGKDCQLKLGPKYALLRKEFIEARKKRRNINKVDRILIFFGGSDPTNETLKAIKAIQLLRNKNIYFDVVVGASNPNKQKIETITNKMKSANFHCQTSKMAELMLSADLAIGAGGSTTWERCYLGLPTITITVAENQRNVNEDLSRLGAIYYIGKSDEVSIHDIKDALKNLINQKEVVMELSKRSLSLFS